MVTYQSMRLVIFGLPGSGKTTLADTLGKKFDLPVYHLDAHFYLKDWQERPKEEFAQILQELIAGEAWIIDGNSMASLEMRFARATHVLYLRPPRMLCLWRVIKRRLRKERPYQDRAPGCPEVLRWRLIKYLWHFQRRYGAQIAQLRRRYPHVHFEMLRQARASLNDPR